MKSINKANLEYHRLAFHKSCSTQWGRELPTAFYSSVPFVNDAVYKSETLVSQSVCCSTIIILPPSPSLSTQQLAMEIKRRMVIKNCWPLISGDLIKRHAGNVFVYLSYIIVAHAPTVQQNQYQKLVSNEWILAGRKKFYCGSQVCKFRGE